MGVKLFLAHASMLQTLAAVACLPALISTRSQEGRESQTLPFQTQRRKEDTAAAILVDKANQSGWDDLE